ncbi:MAG: WD40/YVTN/BNR-like repeat-containing protein, partial [Pyrinomonadaceae bacterium]
TIDGGKTWKLSFQNHSEPTFYDALACWDKNDCLAMADPVDGNFWLIKTEDGGKVWSPIVSFNMAKAMPGEAAFAASGTCLITRGKTDAFMVSGGSAARVFHSTDRGKNWTVVDTPIVHGTSGSGIFSIAMFDQNNGVVVGGDYEKPDEKENTLAFTNDGGATWEAATGLTGYRSAIRQINADRIIAVGTNGSDISRGDKVNWEAWSDPRELNAVGSYASKIKEEYDWSVWAVGAHGLVVRFSFTYIH